MCSYVPIFMCKDEASYTFYHNTLDLLFDMYSPIYRCKYNNSTVLCGVKHLAHGQFVTTEVNEGVQIFNPDS